MKMKNPLIAVSDMEKTLKFYKEVLGLRVIMDFGTNKTLTGGLCLQTKESWAGFLEVAEEEIVFGGLDGELYFEEDEFDLFMEKLKRIDGVEFVHPEVEFPWGQRAVRFYDPDRHIIEVGENIKAVAKRFLDSGMTVEEVAVRMDVPVKFVNACRRK